MSKLERERLRLVEAVIEKRVKQKKAADLLGISVRQVKRWVRSFRTEGVTGLVSRRRGAPSNHRIPDATKALAMQRIEERYKDFGPTLAAEYLHSEGIVISKETLRGWMIAAGLWKAGLKRPVRPHPPRQRRGKTGELVQIDGSPHDWFEGRAPRCTLIAFIDDATSRVMAACFAPAETTQAYFQVLKGYVKAYGCPAALYSDRHGIFTKHDPEDFDPTQFQRATATLSIATIQALTPQAKGRVERLFQTLQDRLVKAMRLAGISSLDEANAFLPTYLDEHNRQFAVAPREPVDAHLSFQGTDQELARICAIHHQRKLSRNLTIQFRGQRYILQTGGNPCYAMQGRNITVVEYRDGRTELCHHGKLLEHRVFDEAKPVSPPLDDKLLNLKVDEILQKPRASTKPTYDHPWRSFRLPHSSPPRRPA